MASSKQKMLREDDLAQFFRVPVYLAVEYPGQVATATNEGITNISLNGVFIATSHPLLMGEHIELRFSLPNAKEPLVLGGTVRWSRAGAGGRREAGTAVGMGVEFDGLSRAQKKTIFEFIKSFITEMREDKK